VHHLNKPAPEWKIRIVNIIRSGFTVLARSRDTAERQRYRIIARGAGEPRRSARGSIREPVPHAWSYKNASFEKRVGGNGRTSPPRRRTHGGTDAGALALVKPLPPQAVAERPGFTRATRPGHNRHRRTEGLWLKVMVSRPVSRRAPRHPFEIQKSHKDRRGSLAT
jgi:hypothetical protein